MNRLTVRFLECEHEGDLWSYVQNLRQSGATVIEQWRDDAAEEGHVTIDVADPTKFLAAFRQTPSYGFSSLAPQMP